MVKQIIALFVLMFKYGGSIDTGSTNVITHAVEKGDSNRLYLWSLSIQQMLDAPSMWLFGFGPGKVLTGFYYSGESHLIYHPHNTYLYLIYSLGFVGGGAMLFLWLLAGWGSIKIHASYSLLCFYAKLLLYVKKEKALLLLISSL